MVETAIDILKCFTFKLNAAPSSITPVIFQFVYFHVTTVKQIGGGAVTLFNARGRNK